MADYEFADIGGMKAINILPVVNGFDDDLFINVFRKGKLHKNPVDRGVGIEPADNLKQLIEGRIDALAKVHTLFVESRWEGAELHRLATQELLAYSGEKEARVRIEGPAVMLEPSTAQTTAISLHELATNAAKYGSLSAAGGHVEISWTVTADGRLSLRWIESGGPAATPPTHRGFGTRIMENMIGQLRGEVRFEWRDQGLRCEIALPLA